MIHVRLQNKILDNKTSAIAFLPLFIWLFAFLGTLFTMFATSYYYLVPVLGIEFLCIIPVFFICRSRLNKAFKAMEGNIYEADLEVKDGKLYYGYQDLQIQYDKKSGIVSLSHEMVAGKYKARALSFWSVVYEEDKNMFLESCEFYHLKVRG